MVENLEVESGGTSGGHPIPSLGPIPGIVWVVGLISFVVVTAVVLPVVLTLPESYSCHEEDKSYFVRIVSQPVMQKAVPPLVFSN